MTTNVSRRIFLLQESGDANEVQSALVAAALNLSLAGSVQAQDMGALCRRIDQLENEVQQLRTRVDNLGPAFAPRQVRIVDPVLSAREARRGSCVVLFGKPDNPDGAAP